MNSAARALAAVLFLPALALAEGKTLPPSRTVAVDALPPEALDEAIDLLREHYLTPAALDERELKRATLQGLLERLGTGVALVTPGAGTEAAVSPFRSEVLDGRIAYVRLGTIRDEHLAQLDQALTDFNSRSLTALILDLRATPAGTDYERAAEVCRRFTPKGRVLFTVRKPRADEERVLTSRDDPAYSGLIAVLVDPDTAGSAEVIAAVLRAETRAMVIGQQTKGEAVEFADLALPGGKALRTAVAEVVLPQGAPVFPGGLTPDLRVEVPQQTTDALLAAQMAKGVAESVFETERRKMNEAALVAGVNPEIEALESAQRDARDKPVVRDVVLQRAVDFITSLRFLGAP